MKGTNEIKTGVKEKRREAAVYTGQMTRDTSVSIFEAAAEVSMAMFSVLKKIIKK